MPEARGAARVRVRVFESTRRPSWRALWQQAVGVGAEAVVILAFVAGGWLERWLSAHSAGPQADQSVSFLAPLRQATPPPAQERLSFVGLGGKTPVPKTEPVLPTGRGSQPVALAEGGGKLVVQETAETSPSDSPRAMSEIEVDSTAALDPSAEGPVYPPELMSNGVQGVVYAQFVVDSTGYADTLTMQVLEKVDAQFVKAVREALPRMKYKAAMFAGRRVPQLVQQAFVFRIQPAGAPVAPMETHTH